MMCSPVPDGEISVYELKAVTILRAWTGAWDVWDFLVVSDPVTVVLEFVGDVLGLNGFHGVSFQRMGQWKPSCSWLSSSSLVVLISPGKGGLMRKVRTAVVGWGHSVSLLS